MTETSILSTEQAQVLRDFTRSLDELTAGPGHMPLTLAILRGGVSLEAVGEALVLLGAYLHGKDFPSPSQRATWERLLQWRARRCLN